MMGLGVLLTVAYAGAAIAGFGGLVLFQGFSMLLFCVAGLSLTPAAISALDAGSSGVGAAGGMLGTLQLIVTAGASALISAFPAFSLAPLLGIVLGCLVVSWALCWATMRPPASSQG